MPRYGILQLVRNPDPSLSSESEAVRRSSPKSLTIPDRRGHRHNSTTPDCAPEASHARRLVRRGHRRVIAAEGGRSDCSTTGYVYRWGPVAGLHVVGRRGGDVGDPGGPSRTASTNALRYRSSHRPGRESRKPLVNARTLHRRRRTRGGDSRLRSQLPPEGRIPDCVGAVCQRSAVINRISRYRIVRTTPIAAVEARAGTLGLLARRAVPSRSRRPVTPARSRAVSLSAAPEGAAARDCQAVRAIRRTRVTSIRDVLGPFAGDATQIEPPSTERVVREPGPYLASPDRRRGKAATPTRRTPTD